MTLILQAGRAEPDATTAMSVTAAETAVDWTDNYSHAPQVGRSAMRSAVDLFIDL